ncbi:MAG: hypothetical protein Q8Q62_09625 [Mesorhizobium sp.]|nr:hypothetical protein [Mesorhizobium sp.]
MHRSVLQAIAIEKLNDAELLFSNARYSNSYYLFGYAAEIAIKARIAGMFLPDTIPDRKFVAAVYSHNLNDLIGLAGLSGDIKASRDASQIFDGHWATVADWNESAGYDVIDIFRSTAMRNAMMDEANGVFGWLQQRW